MSEPRDPIRVGSVLDLLSQTELTEIRTYLLHGERAERAEADDSKVSISARGDTTWLEVRCRMAMGTEDADLIVDRSALFTHKGPIEVDEAVVQEFVEKVGVMSVYPYLREGVFTLASNLGVSAPVMELIRAGSIRVGTLDDGQRAGGPPAQVKRSRSRKKSPTN